MACPESQFTPVAKNVAAFITFILIVCSVHLVGSAVLFGLTSGPMGLLFSPLLAIFGWYFVLPECIGTLVQWRLYNPKAPNFWKVLGGTVGPAMLFMALIGPKEDGVMAEWAGAYTLATGTAGTWSMCCVAFVKKALCDT